jgi:DNA-binding transcriptional regulator LsrR (DeoR family)
LNKSSENHREYEKYIELRWNLKEAVVVSSRSAAESTLLKVLGQAASSYAQRVLSGNEVVSISWGSTLASFINEFPETDMPELKIVQMIGGLGSPEANSHSSVLVHRLAEKTGGTARILSAPGIVSSEETKKELLKDSHISKTLSIAASADIAFVGIGTPVSGSLFAEKTEGFSENIIAELKQAGALGDISLRFFDKKGEFINISLNSRVIGLDSFQIKEIPRVVAVAGGAHKISAVKSALNTGILDVLITDSDTAEKLMEDN